MKYIPTDDEREALVEEGRVGNDLMDARDHRRLFQAATSGESDHMTRQLDSDKCAVSITGIETNP